MLSVFIAMFFFRRRWTDNHRSVNFLCVSAWYVYAGVAIFFKFVMFVCVSVMVCFEVPVPIDRGHTSVSVNRDAHVRFPGPMP